MGRCSIWRIFWRMDYRSSEVSQAGSNISMIETDDANA